MMGQVTGGRLEIKTSGRYTYEMGRALAASKHAADQALWRDWHRFTLELALLGAVSPDATEQKMARVFIVDALGKSRAVRARSSPSPGRHWARRARWRRCRRAPSNMFWFEYNFLFVLAGGGRAEKRGARGPYARRLRAARAVLRDQRRGEARTTLAMWPRYLVFLAENTGLATAAACAAVSRRLAGYTTLGAMMAETAPDRPFPLFRHAFVHLR